MKSRCYAACALKIQNIKTAVIVIESTDKEMLSETLNNIKHRIRQNSGFIDCVALHVERFRSVEPLLDIEEEGEL